MKIKSTLFMCCLLSLLCFTSCGTTYEEALTEEVVVTDFGGGYFTVITEWEDTYYHYKIVYANDTKVKYLIMSTGKKCAITALYNADGSLQVFTE